MHNKAILIAGYWSIIKRFSSWKIMKILSNFIPVVASHNAFGSSNIEQCVEAGGVFFSSTALAQKLHSSFNQICPG
jgi:hypothetical protein